MKELYYKFIYHYQSKADMYFNIQVVSINKNIKNRLVVTTISFDSGYYNYDISIFAP